MAAASHWVLLLACLVSVLCLVLQISLSGSAEAAVEVVQHVVPLCNDGGEAPPPPVHEPEVVMEMVKLRDVIVGAVEEHGRERLVRKRRSWYDNGIVETLEESQALPFSCEIEESMRLIVGEKWIALGSATAQVDVIAISWPENELIRDTLRNADLKGIPIVHASSSEVIGAVVGQVRPTISEKTYVVELLCTEVAAELLLEILTMPFPYWAAELRWAFADDRHTIDMDTVHMAFYRTEPVHYELLHVLNPYTPKTGSEAAVELTVVREALERAYVRAWKEGIRVKIVACVFEEDVGMVAYPYTRASSLLRRSFVDSLGRKVPLMTDMFNSAWEDGGASSDFTIWTNVDIAGVPDLYVNIWRKYSHYNRTASLLREQLDLESIDIVSWPVSMEDLYVAAKTIGVEHGGDDCVIFPSKRLPVIDFGMVFPAYPPVACTLMDQLYFYGLVAKLRVRDTFHLGLDTLSAWRKNMDTVIGRHVNMMSSLDIFWKMQSSKFFYANPQRHCYLSNWCSGQADRQLPKLVNPEDETGRHALQCEVLTSAALEDHWSPQVPGYVMGRTGLFDEVAPKHAVGAKDL